MGSEVVEKRRSLLETLSARFELEPAKFLQVVKSTIFESQASEEELIAFLAICNKYSLDPFRKEIYAFRQGGKIQPIVGIDGWASIANRQDNYDGCEFENEFDKDGKLVATTCVIYRKDRTRPTKVKEYVLECQRNTPAWNTMRSRMMRHRSFIQGIRLAFGISGIMDPDEFEQMVETQVKVLPKKPVASLADLTEKLNGEKAAAAPESASRLTPEPTTGQSAPAAAVPEAIPPRRRRKAPEVQVAPVEAFPEEEPVFDEGGAPVAPAPLRPPQDFTPAKATDGRGALLEVMQLKGQLGDALFSSILSKYGELRDLGTDSLKRLRDDCMKAIG